VVLRDRVERLTLLRHFDVLELHRHSAGACFHDKRSSIENVNDLSGSQLAPMLPKPNAKTKVIQR
jgi:hypothetical protein